MLLLFVGGVMNFIWIAGIAAFVLVEKTAPADHWFGRAIGVALVALGWGYAVVAGLSAYQIAPVGDYRNSLFHK